jgi:hypothetical protein
MADATATHPSPPRGPRFRGDRIYLGWQFGMLVPPPGAPPRRPTPPERAQLNPEWVAAQRREENLLNRPLKGAVCGALVAAALLLVAWITGHLGGTLAACGVAICLLGAGISGYSIWRGEQALRRRVNQEQQRLGKIHAEQDGRLNARHEEHAHAFRQWQARRAAYDQQLQWYAVTLPGAVNRVDVAGGTLAGWSALCSVLGASRLSAGGELTVVDLSEGTVAADLVAVAARSGLDPQVWVLPADLPRLDLGLGLRPHQLADVLSLVVNVSEEHGGSRELGYDNAILERVLDVFGGHASVGQIGAALRALAQVGDPRDDIKLGLIDADQLERIAVMFGRGAADRVVLERAWALESQLRKLAALGTAPVRLPPSRLRVVSTDRRAGVFGNRVLGTFAVTALTHLLRQAPVGRPWQHTVILAGAEKLRGDVLDRLCDACEHTGTGLVLAYRSIPAHVGERLGRGNAALAFMRLGNAQDAKVASEQIGSEHRFVLSQLTETVGAEVSDTVGESYTSTVSMAGSVTATASASENEGHSEGSGRSFESSLMPLRACAQSRSKDVSHSRGTAASAAVTEGITTSTAWGVNTSRAAAASESMSRTSARSRELLVEPHELQHLPPSAMIVVTAAGGRRRVVLADANPALVALPTATMLGMDEAKAAPPGQAGVALRPADHRAGPAAAGPPAGGVPPPGRPPAPPGGPRPAGPGQAGQRPAPVRWRGDDQPPPNLGPPPSRLDWRNRPPGGG